MLNGISLTATMIIFLSSSSICTLLFISKKELPKCGRCWGRHRHNMGSERLQALCILIDCVDLGGQEDYLWRLLPRCANDDDIHIAPMAICGIGALGARLPGSARPISTSRSSKRRNTKMKICRIICARPRSACSSCGSRRTRLSSKRRRCRRRAARQQRRMWRRKRSWARTASPRTNSEMSQLKHTMTYSCCF